MMLRFTWAELPKLAFSQDGKGALIRCNRSRIQAPLESAFTATAAFGFAGRSRSRMVHASPIRFAAALFT